MQYDDEDLQRLFAEMDTKKRLKALKGAFRREANRVRKTALNNLRGSIRTDKDLERGVRAVVFKRKAGFRVTIGAKKAGKSGKEYGFHTNRKGLKKTCANMGRSRYQVAKIEKGYPVFGRRQMEDRTHTRIYETIRIYAKDRRRRAKQRYRQLAQRIN